MKELAIICAGYIPGDIADHQNYQKRLGQNTPMPSAHVNITAKDYGDISLCITFNRKTVELDAALGANVPDDIIAWLEAICLGYCESIFVIDEEGPLTMLRYYSTSQASSGRFSILSSAGDEVTSRLYQQTGETQIICDILIDKKELISKFWQALTNVLKNISTKRFEEVNAEPPVRCSKIIQDFLKEI